MEAEKKQEVKCEICQDTGWVNHSEHRSKVKDYEDFKILVSVECSCRKEAKAG